MEKKYTGFVNTSDNKVYVTSEGMICKRIGIAYYDGGFDYISEEGYIDEIVNDNPYDAIIGTAGDVIHLNQLGDAFSHTDDISEVVKNAKKYFTIATDDLEDCLVFEIDLQSKNGTGQVDIISPYFPNLGYNFIDLSSSEYEDFKKDAEHPRHPLQNLIIPVIVEYAKLIGKRPKIEIYINKDYSYFDDKDLESLKKKVSAEESMYLPRLRRFMNEELDKAIEEEEHRIDRIKKYSERRSAVKKVLETKYDLDPNLF